VDLERGERGWPVEHALPAGLGFGDREVDQLAGGVLGGEVSAGFDDLARLGKRRDKRDSSSFGGDFGASGAVWSLI
jgi:hypothetical protein